MYSLWYSRFVAGSSPDLSRGVLSALKVEEVVLSSAWYFQGLFAEQEDEDDVKKKDEKKEDKKEVFVYYWRHDVIAHDADCVDVVLTWRQPTIGRKDALSKLSLAERCLEAETNSL